MKTTELKQDERALLHALSQPHDGFADSLFEPLGIAYKRGEYILTKFISWRWWDCGVTLRSGWLTRKGIEAAQSLLQEA